VLFTLPAVSPGQAKNGFNLTGALVSEEEILSGGPPRDGIPPSMRRNSCRRMPRRI
jgi:hypothetical protein